MAVGTENSFCEISEMKNIESIVIIQPALYNEKKLLSNFEESIVRENIHGQKTFEEIIENSKNLENCSLVLDYTAIFENVSDSIYFDQVHTNSLGNKIIYDSKYFKKIFIPYAPGDGGGSDVGF